MTPVSTRGLSAGRRERDRERERERERERGGGGGGHEPPYSLMTNAKHSALQNRRDKLSNPVVGSISRKFFFLVGGETRRG